MLVQTLDEPVIQDIGRTFGDYDDGVEPGLNALFASRDAAAAYICGYARGMLRGGFLHTNGAGQEGFIAYKLPGQRIGLRTAGPLLHGLLRSMNGRGLLRFARAMKQAGPGLHDRFDKEKRAHIFVGLVCVREAYQGRGYMRKVLDLAFAEGDRLEVPVVLETDARSKCEKYCHLGMELAGTRSLGSAGTLYDLIRYPAKP